MHPVFSEVHLTLEMSAPAWKSPLHRILLGIFLILVLAYSLQLLWMMFFFKGQSQMGKAFQTIAQRSFQRHHDELPQMRILTADASPGICSFWNFEWAWRRCAVVVIQVRNYQPEYSHQPIVEQEVIRLAELIRTPCTLLPSLRLSDEQQLSRDLNCGSYKKSLKLQLRVESVMADDKWHVTSITRRQLLNDYYFDGSLQ